MTLHSTYRGIRSAMTGLFVLAVACLVSGCASPWWNSFLDPTQIGNFREDRVMEIRKTISFRDKSTGVPGATDPVPADLVATVETYKIGPGDTVSIRLLDFLARDVETEFTPQVDELGYIDIPQLGYIYAEGLTTHELREEIIRQAKEAGIYREDSEPTVVVTMLSQQHRLYQIDGAVPQPGLFRITTPDMRLREAILQAGGLDETVKTVYVFRGAERRKRIKQSDVYPTRTTGPDGDEELPPPPVAPAFLSETSGGANASSGGSGIAPSGLAQKRLAQNDGSVEEEMLEALEAGDPGVRQEEPTGDARPSEDAAPEGEEPRKDRPSLPPFVFVDDRWEVAPEADSDDQRNGEEATAETQPTEEPTTQPDTEPVDWEELASDGEQRVIRIPAAQLRNGNAAYNIVVKHQDYIRLDPGPVGFFYLGGHVNRPGTYALQGEQLTLSQALISAGELGPLAWPTRCEIRRRIDGDREEITQWNLERIAAGLDPDIFIKPHDQIRVGTHAIAPFLATIRNSFRLTYGFGFVYDRNFADFDAFSPQFNPKSLRAQREQQLFPTLFR